MTIAAVDDALTRYEWMRGDPDAGALARWLEERSAERDALFAEPSLAALRQRAEEALRLAASVPLQGAPFLAGDGIFSLDRLPGAVQRTISHRRREHDLRHTVFAAAGEAIDWFFPSPSGTRLAIGVSTGGDERSIGIVIDLASGRRLPERLAGVRHACVAWLPDETGFVYSRYPGDRDYGRELWLHRVGDDQAGDRPLWQPRADSTDWADIEIAPDGATALVHVSIGWTRTDVHRLRIATGTSTPLVTGHEALTRLHFTPSGAIIGVTSIGAPSGRIVHVPADGRSPDDWNELLPESEVVLDDCSVRDSGVFFVGERDMASVVGFVPLTSGEGSPRPAAEQIRADLGIGHVAIAYPTPGQSVMRGRVVRHVHDDTALFAWSTMTDPGRLVTWTVGSRPQTDVGPPVGGGATTRTESIRASDGESIPVLVHEPAHAGSTGHSAGSTADAPIPTLLHGYGGFGLSSTAAYTEVAAAWVALGGRYVVAGIRGGRERGSRWHEAGRLRHRERVFDDFADVADALVARGLCERGQLAIWGSSNGGLLIAATIVRRPDLCAAAHAAVPMTDMLGYHRLSIARLWLSDFGDPDDPDEREWIRAYSPMHTLASEAIVLPDVIVTTGRNDTRVSPFHSYAFVEALRERRLPGGAASVVLREDLRGGHGIGKPADAFVSERADVFALFLAAFARRAVVHPTRADGSDSDLLCPPSTPDERPRR